MQWAVKYRDRYGLQFTANFPVLKGQERADVEEAFTSVFTECHILSIEKQA